MGFLIKKISMNTTALISCRTFGVLVWKLLIIEPISIENELETRLKTILESVGENDFVENPLPTWLI